jgi:hypothetical protein
LIAISNQAGTNLNTMSTGYRTSLDAAIAKLTGTTTTTTTTSTTNTSTTNTSSTNNVSCPVGTTYVGGICKTN